MLQEFGHFAMALCALFLLTASVVIQGEILKLMKKTEERHGKQ